MFSTWDHSQPGKWYDAAGRSRERSDPLSEYRVAVDRLLYAASAAFGACVLILLIS